MSLDSEETARAELSLDLSATERRIVASARRCFETLSVGKTRIEDIASDAGLSRQTIYKYFSSKEEIIDRLGHIEMVKVTAVIRARLQHSDSFADRIAEAIAISVEVARENPFLRRVIEDAEFQSRIPSKSGSIYVWQRAQWSRLLERARRSGELAEDLDIDQIVHWIMLSQTSLLMAPDRLPIREMALKDYVRRFVVEPLLSSRTRPVASIDPQSSALREENDELRGLVLQQALDLHRLRKIMEVDI